MRRIKKGSAEGQSPFAGAWGYLPNYKFLQDWGIQGVERECRETKSLCQGLGGVPQITTSSKIGEYRRLKKRVQRNEVSLPGAWGCPPIFSSPPRLGESEGVDVKYSINLIK
jgi:hypothetical protein